MGYRFMEDYNATYHELFVPARCMVILTGALLAALIFHWTTKLYGYGAALVAVFFFCLSPNILAHAHLVTLDLSGAVGWTACAYLTWRLLEEPTPSQAIILGAVLGLAPVTKLSGIVLPIIVGILVLVDAVRERHALRWYRRLGLLVLAYLIAIGVLNGLYRFEGFCEAFRDIDFVSAKLVSVQAAMPGLRLPVPVPFLKSLDVLFIGDQPHEPAYYLAGQWSLDGWWYYHLVAFLLKTPLGLLLPGLFAIGVWARGGSAGVRDYCVFVPLLAVFVANSAMNPLNIGVRHALPAYPLMAIAASPWIAGAIERVWAGSRAHRDVAAAAASIALLGWFSWANVSIAPRYLQYFNELAGGPNGGHRWLIDSNLDWGQDLVRLSEYMTRRHLSTVHLAYFGRVDPRVYGVDFTPLIQGVSHGPAVVSASFLMGRPYWIWRAPGDLQWAHQDAYAWLQGQAPVARVGSMFVFDLP
jgi:4-amino-4-deoxy-L-arabinose transferase-like glycosyltransferase